MEPSSTLASPKRRTKFVVGVAVVLATLVGLVAIRRRRAKA
jgi:hypothetical protein